MRTKAIASIMLTLLFANMLSMAFSVTPTVVYNNPDEVLSADNTTQPSTKKSPENSWRNISMDSLPPQEKLGEENSSRCSSSEDNWNLNLTDDWKDFAYIDGNKTRLVIGLKNSKQNTYTDLENLATKNSGEIVNTVSINSEIIAVVVEIPLNAMSSFETDVRAAGLASYIEPNMKFQTMLVPDDPYWGMQWGPQKIEADWAWNTTIGDPSVLVAVVDTGIDWDHPDLAVNYVPLGYDWANNDTNPMDDNGHGTHCAGIIAAVINNSIGVAGLAQVRVMAEKGLNQGGSGYEDWLANAIIHAVDQGANIISMSWGGYFHSELIYQAVRYAYDSGVLLVAAAGNDATSIKSFPAGYDEVIAVVATDRYDGRPSWTNYGEWVELAAPGVDIYSTVWNDDYRYASGTSMACPHVAGVAALVWSQFPANSRDWVRIWLRYTADDLGALGFDIYYGYGRINARNAVQQALPDHELIISNLQTPIYVKPGGLGIINATILNFGENNESDIAVELLANDTIVGSASISFLASGASLTVSCSWSPTIEGLYNVTLYVVPVPGEISTENNVVWKYIFVGVPVKAVVLDSEGTDNPAVISSWQALNINWRLFGSTMVYIDYSTLNKENITYADIASTEADVLIIPSAWNPAYGWEFKGSEIEAIKRYVLEGHGLIVTEGTFCDRVPNNKKLAPLVGLDETIRGDFARTDLLHILNSTHPLFIKIPNPFIFPEAYTLIPSDDRWDSNELTGGTYVAKGQFEESAIVTFRGLVYTSPWLEVIPPYYHHHLQLLYNALTWSHYQKPEHELVVSLQAPTSLQLGEITSLNVTIFNLGRNNETDVELQLLINGGVVASIVIPELWVDASHTLSYPWTPMVAAIYNITAYARPVPDEEFIGNNVANEMVRVSYVPKILVVDTPSPEDTGALKRVGYNYTLVSPAQFATVDLYEYNVLFVGWIPTDTVINALLARASDIAGWVAAGNGIVALSEFEEVNRWAWLPLWVNSSMGFHEDTVRILNQAHPVMYDLTDAELSGWGNSYHGYFISYHSAWEALAEGVTAGRPITLAATYGNGRIVITHQDPDWHLYYEYERGAEKFLRNMIEWVNIHIQYEHDLAITIEVPRAVKPHQSAQLNATVHNRGLSNETNVELKILINDALVQSATISELLTGGSYTLSYLWTPTVEGIYNVTAYAPPIPGEDNTQNNRKSARVIVSTLLVALFKNVDPWDYPSNEEALNLYGLPYVVFGSNDFGRVDLSPFTKLVIASDQDQAFYNAMDAYRWWFEEYVNNGGALEIHVADNGWHGGRWIGPLPGGLQWTTYYRDFVTIVDPTHEVVTTPNLITDAELDLWSASMHGYFSVYPAASHIVIVEDITRKPVYLEFNYGRGVVIATGQPLEWAYKQRYSRILENSLLYIKYEHNVAVALDAPVYLELGHSVLLNATVRNRGWSNETDVELYLLINGTMIGNIMIPQLLKNASFTINHLWTPIQKGAYNITAYTPRVPGEDYIANNVITKVVSVFIYMRLYLPHGWVGSGVPMGWHADDASWNYTLPFDFPFYGIRYRTIYISSNGLMTFHQPDKEYYNSLLELTKKFAIAPAWDNWVTYEPYDIYIWQNSTHVGIRWYVAAYYDRSIVANFEAILRNDGTIQFNYGYNNGTISATVGISNGVGHILADDLASLNYFNTIIFDIYRHDVAIQDMSIHPAQVYAGQTVNINVTALNEGDVPESFNVTLYYTRVGNSSIPPEPHPGNSMWIEPSVTYLAGMPLHYRFNVTVWINFKEIYQGDYIGAWQFVIVYEKDYLNATRAGYTAVTMSQWFEEAGVTETRPVSAVMGPFNATHNYVMHGEAWAAGPMAGEGTVGSLSWIEFEITNIPTEPFIGCLQFMTTGLKRCKLINENFEYVENQFAFFEGMYSFVTPSLPSPPPSPPYGVVIGVQEVINLPPNSSAILTFAWNTTGTPLGTYFMKAIASVVMGEVDVKDNIYTGGTVELLSMHDVSIVNVSASRTWVYESHGVHINVTVRNSGDFEENVTITVYYNVTAGEAIGTQEVENLLLNESRTITLTWNTTGVTPCRNYTITAVAIIREPDKKPADNTMESLEKVNVRILGDANGDGIVDISDIYAVALGFGETPSRPRWNPDLDINNDEIIDIEDIYTVAINYGKSI